MKEFINDLDLLTAVDTTDTKLDMRLNTVRKGRTRY